ncbi:hypothetical protein Tco_0715470 [Tanacetum coccineum]
MAIFENDSSVGKSNDRSGHSEQILGNIVYALGGKPKRKDKQATKDIVFLRLKTYLLGLSQVYLSLESVNDNQEPLPPLPKLHDVEPKESPRIMPNVLDLPNASKV